MQTGTIWCHDRLIRFLIAERRYLHVVTREIELIWFHCTFVGCIILDFITIIIIMFGEYSVVLRKTAYIKFCHIALYWTMVSWADAMWVPSIYVPLSWLSSLSVHVGSRRNITVHTQNHSLLAAYGLVQLDAQPAIHAHNSTTVLLHNMSCTNCTKLNILLFSTLWLFAIEKVILQRPLPVIVY